MSKRARRSPKTGAPQPQKPLPDVFIGTDETVIQKLVEVHHDGIACVLEHVRSRGMPYDDCVVFVVDPAQPSARPIVEAMGIDIEPLLRDHAQGKPHWVVATRGLDEAVRLVGDVHPWLGEGLRVQPRAGRVRFFTLFHGKALIAAIPILRAPVAGTA